MTEETEMIEESMEKTTSTPKQKKPRDNLFSVLNEIIGFAEQKRKTSNLSDKTKQAWSRITIQAISSYGALLHDCELSELSERLEALEAKQALEDYR
jgi:hypothetical protein